MYQTHMALLIVAIFSHAAAGEETRLRLDAARAEYETAIEATDTIVEEFFQKAISRHQKRGDFERTVEAQKLLDEFTAEGVLQDVPGLQPLRRRVKSKYIAASHKYRRALLRAIEEYTRAENIDAAKDVKQSLDKFDEDQEKVLAKRFPSTPAPEQFIPAPGEERTPSPEAEQASVPQQDTNVSLTGTWMVKYPQYVVSRPYEFLDLGRRVLIFSNGHEATKLISSRGELTWDREHRVCSGTVEEEFSNGSGKHRASIRVEVVNQNTLRVRDYTVNFDTGRMSPITVYYYREK